MPPTDLLALDVGTQSVRALVFRPDGSLVARALVPLQPPYATPQPGWAEQDPVVWWDALAQACQALWAEGKAQPAAIAGLALSTQRGTVVCAAADGTPLRPAIVWPDQRRCSAPPALGPLWSAAFAVAGASGLVRRLQQQAEANWLAQHEPALWARCERYTLLSGWLTHRLVGDWVDAVGHQVGYLPFHYRQQRWAPHWDWKWRALAVRPGQLPRLVAGGQRLGGLTAAAARRLGLPAGLPLNAAAADKACEVLGCGALAPDAMHLSLGTTATLNTTQPRYVEIERLLPAYPAALPGAFNTEVQVPRGFWLVSWFLREFGAGEVARAAALGVAPESLLDELLAATPPGAEGLLLQPTWAAGLRTPGPEARGALVGLQDHHGRAHVYRALVEGLLLALRQGRVATEHRLRHPLTRLLVSGGGAQSDGVMQIAADVFGLPAERGALHEASALGAAMLCATGLGLHADVASAARSMAHAGRRFEPDPRAVRCYDDLFNQVLQPLYGRLAPLYRRLHAINPPA
jgi:sugar (pentulose or hexulose) kinase